MRAKLFLTAAVAAIVTAGVVGGAANAALVTPQGNVEACANKTSGALRVFDRSKGQKCSSSETYVGLRGSETVVGSTVAHVSVAAGGESGDVTVVCPAGYLAHEGQWQADYPPSTTSRVFSVLRSTHSSFSDSSGTHEAWSFAAVNGGDQAAAVSFFAECRKPR